MVPPRCAMPRTVSRVIGITSSSPIRPANPRLMPSTSHPRSIADRTAALMTALRPGASPPPVEIAILISLMIVLATHRRCATNSPTHSAGAPASARFEQSDDFPRRRVPFELGLLEYG